MDIDTYLEDILDPLAEIYREVNLDDIYNLLGKPAKSVRVQENLQVELEARKRTFSLILLDLGTKCKY